MASAFKDAVMDKVSGSSERKSSDGGDRASNYKLSITAGPSYDKSLQKVVQVNGPSLAVSDQIKLKVRIKDYSGLPKSSPSSSPYFSQSEHAKDTFSVAFSITPTEDIHTKDLYFGLDTGHNPIRKFGLPKTLVNTAFKIVKELVDPCLTCDAYADEPWVMGPALCSATMNFRVGEQISSEENSNSSWDAPDDAMTEGATGSGNDLRSRSGMPAAADKRRKYFMNEAKRADFVLEKGRTYDFDFANAYIDWKNYALKLPGFSWSPLKHIGDKSHKVRYVLKNPKTGEVWFVVMCTLLAGEEMRMAVEKGEGPAGEASGGQDTPLPAAPAAQTSAQNVQPAQQGSQVPNQQSPPSTQVDQPTGQVTQNNPGTQQGE